MEFRGSKWIATAAHVLEEVDTSTAMIAWAPGGAAEDYLDWSLPDVAPGRYGVSPHGDIAAVRLSEKAASELESAGARFIVSQNLARDTSPVDLPRQFWLVGACERLREGIRVELGSPKALGILTLERIS